MASPTTILMLSANPRGTVPLRLDEERREIEAGLLERSRLRDQFQIITKTAVRPRDFQRAMLDHNPQVVHFSGHGVGEQGLALEDETGKVKLVSADALAALFELYADRLHCVVLNACYAEVQAAAIVQHIPYAIGMSDQIGDRAAIEFAVAFYDAIGAGRDVEFAYKNACVAIKLAGIPAAHIPILHKKVTGAPSEDPKSEVTAPDRSSSFLNHRDTEVTEQHSRVPLAFTAYNSATFTGRDDELADLTQALDNGCRLLIIHGMTGIGKTTLAERLAAESLGSLTYIPVVLDRGVGGVEFTRGAIAILEAMDDDTAQQLPDDQILPYLLKRLQDTPVWLQLDSLEYLLRPNDQGQPEFADPTWVDFFEQWLRDRRCPSRLILTSQALPEDLLERIDRQAQWWQAYPLEGLEVEQYLTLFENCGVSPKTEAETKQLCEIATYFQGHPYILNMIAADMGSRLFAGNISKYWQDYWLPRQQQDTAYLSQEQRARKWVNQTLAQLPDLPRQMLQHCAVFQRAVPETFYPQMLPDLPEGERLVALAMLKARALVQETDIQAGQRLLQQHNLIRDTAHRTLKADPSRWQAAHRQAAHLWLTAYQPAPNAPNLETVRAYLEAFDHYYEMGDWERASELFMQPLDTPANVRLPWQLDTWGYFREEISLCEKLVGKSTLEIDIVCWRGIGNGYRGLGLYSQAIETYQHSLEIAQEMGDRSDIAKVLNNLGIAYKALGQYQQAIDYHQQNLITFRELGDRRSEGVVLGNLGNAYDSLGQYEQAIDYYQQHLTIAREMGDRAGEGRALGNLGNSYDSLRQYERAIYFHQLRLTIAREIGDRRGEGIALVNMGVTQLKRSRYPASSSNNYAALEIFREIGDRANEAEALINLSAVHQALGEVDKAQQLCQQALALATELGIPLQAECETLLQSLGGADAP